jgi:hypothetical protein
MDHLDCPRGQALDEMVGVISLVGEQGFGLDLRQQRPGLCDVMDLPASYRRILVTDGVRRQRFELAI